VIGASKRAERNAGLPGAAALERSLAAAGLDWIVADWPAPPGVLALTTTRTGSEDAEIRSNRDDAGVQRAVDELSGTAAKSRQLAALLPSPPVHLKQVHGASVVILDDASTNAARLEPPVADAAVTRLRGIVCAVSTADCLPVVLTDRRGDTIGIAHAGWRGLAAGVLRATVSAMSDQGARPDELIAWFGPAIGPSAFEVGADVFTAFCDRDPGAASCFAPYREGKWLADIYALARRQLAACDVNDVSGGGFCTFTDATRFHSYRRERATGRMMTLVWR
jgi:YfiH family protein